MNGLHADLRNSGDAFRDLHCMIRLESWKIVYEQWTDIRTKLSVCVSPGRLIAFSRSGRRFKLATNLLDLLDLHIIACSLSLAVCCIRDHDCAMRLCSLTEYPVD